MSNTKSTAKSKQAAIKAVKSLLYARRSNNNPKREQAAYDKLSKFCDANNLEMGQVIAAVSAHLKATSIAARMNGLV